MKSKYREPPVVRRFCTLRRSRDGDGCPSAVGARPAAGRRLGQEFKAARRPRRNGGPMSPHLVEHRGPIPAQAGIGLASPGGAGQSPRLAWMEVHKREARLGPGSIDDHRPCTRGHLRGRHMGRRRARAIRSPFPDLVQCRQPATVRFRHRAPARASIRRIGAHLWRDRRSRAGLRHCLLGDRDEPGQAARPRIPSS